MEMDDAILDDAGKGLVIGPGHARFHKTNWVDDGDELGLTRLFKK